MSVEPVLAMLRALSLSVFLSLLILGTPASAQTHSRPDDWWKGAVIYTVYPRSFADSDGDGIGDLNGITAHLDYLQALGVDAIWLAPVYPSPQVDFGYDVSDYTAINPQYGSMADFDRLLAEAKRRHIRLIMDYVVNHSSDQHPWFLESKSSRSSPYRNWYIWRSGKGPGRPPNNWQSVFGGSAWEYDKTTDQYYYHAFYPEQPDINWRNPATEAAMLGAARFWLRRGVDGFRLDAVDRLYEDPELRDNFEVAQNEGIGLNLNEGDHTILYDEVHEALQRLRKITDAYHAVLIGETWAHDFDQLGRYYGPHGDDELQMPMDLMFSQEPLNAVAMRRHIESLESARIWPTFVIGNMDMVRSFDRYGDGAHNERIAKLMATLYLTLRGSAVMYYGEELGMRNNDPTRQEDVKDPIGKLYWPDDKGRDGERTPMQWTDGPNAGFTTGTPWLPVPESAKLDNVVSETGKPDSMLSHYTALLALRKERVMRDGRLIMLNRTDDAVLSYLRQDGRNRVFVALNMSAQPRTIRVNLRRQWGSSATLDPVLLVAAETLGGVPMSVRLAPFGSIVARVK